MHDGVVTGVDDVAASSKESQAPRNSISLRSKPGHHAVAMEDRVPGLILIFMMTKPLTLDLIAISRRGQRSLPFESNDEMRSRDSANVCIHHLGDSGGGGCGDKAVDLYRCQIVGGHLFGKCPTLTIFPPQNVTSDPANAAVEDN